MHMLWAKGPAAAIFHYTGIRAPENSENDQIAEVGAHAVAQMAQYYELVVYTDQLPTYADPILDRLDPQRFIQYRLYRDSTQYVNGKHVSLRLRNGLAATDKLQP